MTVKRHYPRSRNRKKQTGCRGGGTGVSAKKKRDVKTKKNKHFRKELTMNFRELLEQTTSDYIISEPVVYPQNVVKKVNMIVIW